MPIRLGCWACLLAGAALFAQDGTLKELAERLEAAQTDAERSAIASAEAQNRELYKLVSDHATDRSAHGDWAGALKSYRAALALSAARSDNPETARNLWNTGNTLYKLQDLSGALDPLHRAFQLATETGDRRTAADSLQVLATCDMLLGRLEEAETVERRAIAAFRELGDAHQVANLTVTLSTILGEKGDQDAKAEILRRMIREAEQAGYNDVLGRALNNLGVVYYDQGDYERSLQYVSRAADIYIRVNPDPSMPARFHSNIGVMHQFLGHDREAFAEYAMAEESAVKIGDVLQQMHIKNNRAALYRVTGQPAKALEEMRVVARFYDSSPMRTDALRVAAEYAQTLLAVGDAETALSVCEKALVEARQVGGPDIIRLIQAPMAEAYLRTGRRKEARTAFLEAIAAIEAIKLTGREDEKENFFHEKGRAYQGMVRLAYEEGNRLESLQFAERAKARLLLDVLRGARANLTRTMTADERQRESDLATALSNLDSRIAKEGSRVSQELLDRRNRSAVALDELRQSLYLAHPELRLQRAEFRPIGMAQIAALLRDSDTTLVEFTLTGDKAYVFTITRDRAGKPLLQTRELRDPGRLAADVESFRSQMGARDPGYRDAARSLYSRLFGESATGAPLGKRLIIVPDGPLWNLPFQALITPRGKHLVEESSVFYAPSLTAIDALQKRGRNQTDGGHTLLATAALPETMGEIEQVGKLYGPRSTALLTGQGATKEHWRTEAPHYRILHFATHGVLESNNPLSSYLILQGDDTLTAREILSMNLSADLAVLSACETARGKFRFGEGMIGMSWAFLVAGSPTTVVSQWKVDSESTASLMVAFHRALNVKAGQPLSGRAEALRQAQLQLLATPQYRHPFYWAGFVMIGDGY